LLIGRLRSLNGRGAVVGRVGGMLLGRRI
jgi:hypothetical protein